MAGVNNQTILVGEAPVLGPETGGPDGAMDLDAIERTFAELGEAGLLPEEFEVMQRAHAEAQFRDGDWYGNLVERIPESERGYIAAEIVRWVQFDEQSRQRWFERERRGLELLGVYDPNLQADAPDTRAKAREGLSQVVHPGLAEAGIQFYSRAIVEMWPPEGPVKTLPLGQPTEQLKRQAERVEGYLNWLYTVRMPGGFSEEQMLLMRLDFAGSAFKKVYWDPLENCVMAVFIEPADFIVPFAATNLGNAPRYTHRLWESEYVVKRKMASGWYAETSLTFPTEARYPETRKAIDEVDGKSASMVVEDRRHEVLECHAYYDIKPLREPGASSEIPLPWVITVDRDSQKILAVRRGWKRNDEARKRRPCAVHFKFLPGFGFYGWGWFHWLGSLIESQTGAVRALLDSASYDNHQGGFRSKDARVPSGTLTPLPGEWVETEASAEELAKAFLPLPRHPPSEALFKLVDYFDGAQQRLSSTTEAMVGDANSNGPVGTILALIEQGMKPAMAVHLGLHEAKAEELAIVSDLLADFLPERFTYTVPGENREVFAADFDDRVDVRPVSDPRVVTNTQRIAQCQSVLQLAQQFPALYDAEEVNRRMLEALRVPDVESVLAARKPVRMDPVQEGMAMLTGRPAKVFPDQYHMAHVQVHQAWFKSLPPEFQQQVQGAFMAHLAEHLAWNYRNGLEQAMGLPMPYPATMDAGADEDDRQDIPEDVDDEISIQTARFVQGLAMGQQAMQQQAEIDQQRIEQERNAQALAERQAQTDQATQAEQDRKDAAFEREQARRDAEAQAEIERTSAIAQAERAEAARDSEAERVRQAEEEYRGLE